MLRIVLIMVALAAPLAARADAVGQLKRYIATVHSGQANFIQEVLDENGKRLKVSSGTMQFSRPGKFRWEYQKPYEEIMVGDGAHVWMYDVDLQQITVRKLDTALGVSPAALLSGSHEIERDFELKDVGCEAHAETEQVEPASRVAGMNMAQCGKDAAALEWLEATPRTKETSFRRIRMAFNARSELMVMELYDAFGHVTVLHFSGILRNPRFPRELFKFVPPPGVDVLGDE
jgi:outer membrane lipoprotein carrier protein